MCGIVGFICKESNHENNLVKLENIKKTLYHRGPDDHGIWHDKRFNVYLGHQRLSILDLSYAASQPMESISGRYVIIYNGEIYNHLSLRNKINKNYPNKVNWKSTSDTETLVNYIDLYGFEATMKAISGMFAFAIWDNKNKKLILCRDSIGEKPLYYGWVDNTFIFSSELKAFQKFPNFKNNISKEALSKFFRYSYVPNPLSIYEDIYKLQPGCYLEFKNIGFDKPSKINFAPFENSNIKIQKWWHLKKNENFNLNSKNEIKSKLIETLNSSVKSQMISDVKLGSFLSGGVDSPLVSYNASVLSNDFIETFSLGSDSDKYNESYYAEQYSEYLKTKHNTTLLNSNNAIDVLEKSVLSTGEPLGDLSILPTWELSKLASKTVTVALSGDGGDELFFGYERFQSIANNHWLKKLPYSMKYLLLGLDKLTFNSSYINDCVLYKSPGEAHFGLNSRFPDSILNNVIPNLKKITLPEEYKNYNYTSPNDINELFYRIRKAEYYGMMQKTLAKVDRASMAHGLEVRVPFLKKTMIEKVISLGINIHQPQKFRKKFLYQLLEKKFPGIQPERKKKGFSVPLSMWIRTGLRDSFYERLLDEKFCHTYDINKLVLEKILDNHINKKMDAKWPLFTLYSLAIWSKDGRVNV